MRMLFDGDDAEMTGPCTNTDHMASAWRQLLHQSGNLVLRVNGSAVQSHGQSLVMQCTVRSERANRSGTYLDNREGTARVPEALVCSKQDKVCVNGLIWVQKLSHKVPVQTRLHK